MTGRGRRRAEQIFDLLLTEYGRQRWWPADTPFEVCVGAILTQSTSWRNVEKALGDLKAEGVLNPDGLASVRKDKLARLIRPSLYHNVKARKLKEFVGFLREEYDGVVEDMGDAPLDGLREQLLGVWGIGPETADSILLYALGKPSFVVDAYTKRIFTRMGWFEPGVSYDEVKGFFESSLPEDAGLYNEYHALIVEHGKNTCKTSPLCGGCCLEGICEKRI